MLTLMSVTPKGELWVDPHNGTLVDATVVRQLIRRYEEKIAQLTAITEEQAQCAKVEELGAKLIEKDKELIKLHTIIDSAAAVLGDY